MLDRDPAKVDVAPLWAIPLPAVTNKFPLWNTNKAGTPPNIGSIKEALDGPNLAAADPTADAKTTYALPQQTKGLLNPDGILAVVPNTDPKKPTTVIYVQKILNGDNTGSTRMAAANQCKAAPVSGKINHDISNVRLAETMDGINFTDKGIVKGLNDPFTVDYTKTRYISPRGTLIDIDGKGGRWGLLFAGGNCLDGDSDSFHYIGYAESTDLVNWTVYNDINNPIGSINAITRANQTDGKTVVTVPATKPLMPTQPWFAQRLYGPSCAQVKLDVNGAVDDKHVNLTFAGYAVQTPNSNLLSYRQIGSVTLTASKALPKAPNNVNMQ
jgi:hypothetical protein